jgi:hypothetical protein
MTSECPLCCQRVEAGAVYCNHCNTFLLPHRRIGEIMIQEKMITGEQLSQGLSRQKRLGELLVDMGAVTSEQVDRALRLQKESAVTIARVARHRGLIKAALGLLAIFLAGVFAQKWMQIDELRSQMDAPRAGLPGQLEGRITLAAIQGLKSSDSRTVDACFDVLRRGTGLALPKEFNAWMNWYSSLALPSTGSGPEEPAGGLRPPSGGSAAIAEPPAPASPEPTAAPPAASPESPAIPAPASTAP